MFTPKIERNLGWAVVLLLFAGCLLVLRPFVSALLWAVVLCISSWPVYHRLLGWLGNRRTLAAALMTLGDDPYRAAAIYHRGHDARR